MIGKQAQQPLPPKPKDQMPHVKLNMTYKEWMHRHEGRHKWRNRRWAVLIFINLLFVVSFTFDLAVLEGSLNGSRLIGFYLMDPYVSLELASISIRTHYWPHVTMNMIIGLITILTFYLLMGGRTFCSWVCPYHFIAEWAEKLHKYLVKKRKVKEHHFNRGLRYVFWIGFLILALVTKRLIFQEINPVGIVSRALIYGPGLILLWILALITFEIVYSQRFWCRYVCPIGTTWSFVGKLSPVTIKFEYEKCGHCRKCQDVCLVPHVLWFVVKGRATQAQHYVGSDCIKCGYCVDICPGDALNFSIKGLSKIV